MRRAWLIVLVLVALGAGMILKDQLIQPPSVRASASGGFDTADALARLRRVLGPERPHPADSPEADDVRARLVAELRGLGAAPRVTDSFTCNANVRGGSIGCARVRNVVVTIGPATGRHLLLVSHYDSTPVGPGAADDGIGMAAMLGTAAALVRNPPPLPVSLLFNEGEEAGLIGARAFLDVDPLAARVDTLVNLESRGVEGPALMFETSRPNGAALALYRAGAARPAANSLSTDFYRMIPNSTDVDVFQGRGWTILNLAVIGNETRYHSAGDTLAALDPRSLQHMGDQALGIVRARGTTSGDGEVVYADLLGRALPVVPLPIAVGLLGLLLAGATILLARERWSAFAAVATVLGALVATAALAWAAQGVAGVIRDGDYWRGHPGVIAAAADLTAMLGAGAILLLVGRRVGAGTLRIACWWTLLLFGAAVAWIAPGGAIFFLAAPALALGAVVAARRAPVWAVSLAVAAALLQYLMLAPLLALSGVLLGYGASWLLALVAALILLPFLVEARDLLRARPALSAALLAAPALAAWIAVLAVPAYTDDRQQPFGVEHVTDRSAGTARWMIVNDGAPLPRALDGFTPGTKVGWSTRPRWATPAPAIAAAPRPSLELLSQTQMRGNGRILRLRLSTGGAQSTSLRVPAGARLTAAAINGSRRAFGQVKPGERYNLHCRGRSCDGAEVTLVAGAAPLDIELIGLAPGLPAEARRLVDARPALARPQYTPDQRVSVERLRL